MACTIAPADIPERVELVGRMRAAALDVTRTEHGLLLGFPADPAVEADVRRFTIDEKRCCTFWELAVEVGEARVELVWEGPDGAAPILDQLFTYFTGDGDLTEVEGLL
jgi:hypothetical protein